MLSISALLRLQDDKNVDAVIGGIILDNSKLISCTHQDNVFLFTYFKLNICYHNLSLDCLLLLDRSSEIRAVRKLLYEIREREAHDKNVYYGKRTLRRYKRRMRAYVKKYKIAF